MWSLFKKKTPKPRPVIKKHKLYIPTAHAQKVCALYDACTGKREPSWLLWSCIFDIFGDDIPKKVICHLRFDGCSPYVEFEITEEPEVPFAT